MVWLGAVMLGGAMTAALQQATPEVVELPDKAREALEERWDRGAPADLPAEVAACLGNGTPPVSRLAADLDNDGKADYVLAVETGDGLRLVALLTRIPEYVVHELDALGGPESPVSLALASPGTSFTPGGGIADYYSAPTVLGRRCGQPDVAYIWTGFSFRKTALSGGTAPAPPRR